MILVNGIGSFLPIPPCCVLCGAWQRGSK